MPAVGQSGNKPGPGKPKLDADLDGIKLSGLIKVDNSDLRRQLNLSGPPGQEIVVLIENNQLDKAVHFRLPTSGRLTVNFAQIMQHIPLGTRTKLFFYANFHQFKSLTVERSAMDLPADPGKVRRDITPLYEEIAADLNSGKPLVIATHVILWDWSFTGAGRGTQWAIGDKADTNIYWGARYGVYTMFRKDHDWQLVGESDGQAVFKRSLKPSLEWRTLGVNKPFDVYAVFHVHHAAELREGYAAYARDLFGTEAEAITLNDGTVITAGGQSRIVGLIGHMDRRRGEEAILTERRVPLTMKKGTFMTTCLSAESFADLVVDNDIFGLLFNTQYIAAEGYTFPPFFDATGQAAPGKKLVAEARAGYQQYHRQTAIPARFFVNSSTSLNEHLFPYEGDQDNDGLSNRIDPEPYDVNKYDKNGENMMIFYTDGSRLEIAPQP
ncbi:MAG: hypothetical protein WC529_08280 [Candidatus Margulisiibacteriota bacterium]